MLKGRFERLALKGLLWVVIVFLVGAAVLLAGATWEVRQKERIAFSEKENARIQYEETAERKQNLEESVENLSHERGMEEEFRKRFPVAREGEEVIVLVDADVPETSGENEDSKGFWNRLKTWFGF